MYLAKTNALISCPFTYAKSMFSHDKSNSFQVNIFVEVAIFLPIIDMIK